MIFDAFNNILVYFRPFFSVGGLPFPWAVCEKHLTVVLIDENNVSILFEKAM